MEGDLLRGHLDVLLLGVVAGEPMHGYGVIEALRGRTEGALDLREGTVYPALHRLERAGFLASDWSQQAGRRRRVYRITRRGTRELAARKRAWREFSLVVDHVLRPAT